MAKPSESELKLLKVLWRGGRMSARELHDACSAQTGWGSSTTRKLLDRMVEKDLVTVDTVHGVKVFLPAASKLETIAGLVRDFSRNVLDMDDPFPAAAFARSGLIDADEIADLELLLQDLAEKADGSEAEQ